MRYLILLLALLTLSCSNKKSEKSSEINTDTLSYRYDSVKAVSNIIPKSSSKDTAKAVIRYPIFSDQKISRAIELRIASGIDIERKFTGYQGLVQSFIGDFEKFTKEDTRSGVPWFMTIDQKVKFNTGNIISILNTYFFFQGGAHPNTVYISYNINPKNYSFLTIDSLIKPDKMGDFNTLAERIFRENEKLSPGQSLHDNYFFENDAFKLPETFIISHRGILFTYSPYEIKPYAAGKTELLIPFEQIKDLIRDNYTSTLLQENKL